MSPDKSRLVWSSEQGDLRKSDSKPAAESVSLPPQQQTVYLHRESKGKGGKVTVLKGLKLTPADMASLAKTLKSALGVGGTVKDGVIEIQSQEREKIAGVLTKLGYKVKLAGG